MRNRNGSAGWIHSVRILAILCMAVFLFASCGKFTAKIDARKGNALYTNGDYLEAIAQYKKAIEKDPSMKLAYLNTGLSYFNLIRRGAGDKAKEYSAEAVKAFEEYVKLAPDDEKKIMEFEINVYTQTQQYDEAVNLLKKKLAKTPKDLESVKAIANIYSSANRFEDSLDWNRKAAEIDSKNPEAYYAVGAMCWQKSFYGGNLDPGVREKYIIEGIDMLNKAISMKNNYYQAITYLGLLYREQAKWLETDDVKKEELTAMAVELQNKAMELKAAEEQAAGGADEKKEGAPGEAAPTTEAQPAQGAAESGTGEPGK